jgi:tRNA threonylcarbamoyladenosine biosynthesis protein TsaE
VKLPSRNTITLISHSAAQTVQIGATLGHLLARGDVICLSGDLGAGKTALASGIGRGWGALEPVNSPTFVFVHEHRRRDDDQRLYHVDCYRLSGPDDAESIGIEDVLAGDHPVMIEWPERILPLLPPLRLDILLEPLDEDEGDALRRLTATASAQRSCSARWRRCSPLSSPDQWGTDAAGYRHCDPLPEPGAS